MANARVRELQELGGVSKVQAVPVHVACPPPHTHLRVVVAAMAHSSTRRAHRQAAAVKLAAAAVPVAAAVKTTLECMCALLLHSWRHEAVMWGEGRMRLMHCTPLIPLLLPPPCTPVFGCLVDQLVKRRVDLDSRGGFGGGGGDAWGRAMEVDVQQGGSTGARGTESGLLPGRQPCACCTSRGCMRLHEAAAATSTHTSLAAPLLALPPRPHIVSKLDLCHRGEAHGSGANAKAGNALHMGQRGSRQVRIAGAPMHWLVHGSLEVLLPRSHGTVSFCSSHPPLLPISPAALLPHLLTERRVEHAVAAPALRQAGRGAEHAAKGNVLAKHQAPASGGRACMRCSCMAKSGMNLRNMTWRVSCTKV